MVLYFLWIIKLSSASLINEVMHENYGLCGRLSLMTWCI